MVKFSTRKRHSLQMLSSCSRLRPQRNNVSQRLTSFWMPELHFLASRMLIRRNVLRKSWDYRPGPGKRCMSQTIVIGDIHGCYDELVALLELVQLKLLTPG